MKIFFLTWASGVWKTTLVSELKQKYSENKNWIFLHFDSIWVPSFEKMVEEYGSWENWQKETTFKWIDKILNEYNNENIVIFEWQVNMSFIKEWFLKHNFSGYKIILVDCNEKIMKKRLIEDRKQGELVTDDMKNWLRYLRKQAKDLGIDIIDTSELTKEEVLNFFIENYASNIM